MPNPANSTAGSTESRAMYQSVYDNKGFYIARFEAGIEGTTDNFQLSSENQKTPDGNTPPLSQKGVGVWNKIPWGGSTSDTSETDGLPGNDNANGAVKVARSMYTKSSTCGVTSTLCYGVQWDAALKFIEPNYGEYKVGSTSEYNIANDSYVKTATESDGTVRGHYNASAPTTTGSNNNYQMKHIYDMAGNVFEWTMEAYVTDRRVGRGGSYGRTPSDIPACSRGINIPDDTDDGLGLRVALYL